MSDYFRAIRDRYIEAYVARDAAGLASLFTENCIVLPPDNPVIRGKAGIQAFYQEEFTQLHPSSLNIQAEEEVVFGDWGNGCGTWAVAATLKATGAAVAIEGKYANVVKRQADGVWKIHRHTWNAPTQFAAMAAPRG